MKERSPEKISLARETTHLHDDMDEPLSTAYLLMRCPYTVTASSPTKPPTLKTDCFFRKKQSKAVKSSQSFN